MQTFKTDKELFLSNEFKSWVKTILSCVIIYFVLKLLLKASNGEIGLALIFVLIFKLRDRLIEYHTKEITIDKTSNKIILHLESLMLGNISKSYSLIDTRSQINHTKQVFFSKFASSLKIYLPDNKIFRLNERYGFSQDTLLKINTNIKQL